MGVVGVIVDYNNILLALSALCVRLAHFEYIFCYLSNYKIDINHSLQIDHT